MVQWSFCLVRRRGYLQCTSANKSRLFMDITPIYHVIQDSEGFKALERRSSPIV